MLHKAAVLARWVSGVGFVVYQPDWPPLWVAASQRRPCGGEVWISLLPGRFRHELLGSSIWPGRPSRLIGPFIGGEGVDLRVQIVVDQATTVDRAGLYITEGLAYQSVSFATLTAVPVAAAGSPVEAAASSGLSGGWNPRQSPPLFSRIDDELGIRLVTCSYPAADPLRAELAHAATFEAMITASVEEITLLSAA